MCFGCSASYNAKVEHNSKMIAQIMLCEHARGTTGREEPLRLSNRDNRRLDGSNVTATGEAV